MAPNNVLSCWGNEKTMNLNSLILTNIQSSPYFKVNLYELKTYHEVIDEIYYKVTHLEPWEKGSRKTAGQTGMCGGVRGVGAGGIVSSAYCLLYKLYTLKLTRKQLIGLIEHTDSPYIRGLGFMYIRYTQDPKEMWDWYEPYLDDDEEIDVKAGGGHVMLMGEMIQQWMTKLEWYCTLFPRIPVPVQKDVDVKLKARMASRPPPKPQPVIEEAPRHITDDEVNFGEAERYASTAATRRRSPTPPYKSRHRTPPLRRSPPPPRHRERPVSPLRSRNGASPFTDRGSRYRDDRRSPPRHKHSRSPRRGNSPLDFQRELQRERERQTRDKDRHDRPESRSKEGQRSKEKRRSRSKERRRSRSKERSHKQRSKSQERKGHRSSRERSERSHKERKRSRSGSREKKRHKHKHKNQSPERRS